MQLRFETAYNFTANNALSFVYTREKVDEQPFNLKYDADEFIANIQFPDRNPAKFCGKNSRFRHNTIIVRKFRQHRGRVAVAQVQSRLDDHFIAARAEQRRAGRPAALS